MPASACCARRRSRGLVHAATPQRSRLRVAQGGGPVHARQTGGRCEGSGEGDPDCAAALAEGLGLGEALGIDLTLLREVFSQTGAASRVLETDGEDMQQRAHDCFFSVAHAAKDSGIALDLANHAGLALPIAEATLMQYKRLIESGKGGLDKSAVAELTFKGRIAG